MSVLRPIASANAAIRLVATCHLSENPAGYQSAPHQFSSQQLADRLSTADTQLSVLAIANAQRWVDAQAGIHGGGDVPGADGAAGGIGGDFVRTADDRAASDAAA